MTPLFRNIAIGSLCAMLSACPLYMDAVVETTHRNQNPHGRMAKMAENHRHPAANRNMAISAPEATIAARAAQKSPACVRAVTVTTTTIIITIRA